MASHWCWRVRFNLHKTNCFQRTQDKGSEGRGEDAAGREQEGVVQVELALGDPTQHHGGHGGQEPDHQSLRLRRASRNHETVVHLNASISNFHCEANLHEACLHFS